MSHLWTRTIFELGLYSSQASINDSTVCTSKLVLYSQLYCFHGKQTYSDMGWYQYKNLSHIIFKAAISDKNSSF